MFILLITERFHFNSQPHEEADIGGQQAAVEQSKISTHSLTKRLTELSAQDKANKGISTHSLTKRLTGCDWNTHLLGSISTHSLTKRLTLSSSL